MEGEAQRQVGSRPPCLSAALPEPCPPPPSLILWSWPLQAPWTDTESARLPSRSSWRKKLLQHSCIWCHEVISQRMKTTLTVGVVNEGKSRGREPPEGCRGASQQTLAG